MGKIREKDKCIYRVKYFSAQIYNGWQIVRWKEIDPLTFDPTIPEDSVGYEIQYGTDFSIYNSYGVYIGEVKSFKEIKEKFPKEKLSYKITDEMIQKGKTTEELRELFHKTDLQKRFEVFVKECEMQKYTKDSQKKIGIIVKKNNHLQYVYIDDIIVSD